MMTKECPSCGRKDTKIFNKSLFVWRCSSCGLVFKDISMDESAGINKDAWSDLCNHRDETGATNLRLSRIYTKKLISSLNLRDLAGLKVLDFGAGRGDMLTALSEAGADVYGVEPFGCEYLKGKGFKVFRGIEEIPKGFLLDGIIINDVIEHLFYPWDVINKLYGLLNPAGWVYIATPNSDSINARIFGSHWRELYNKGHVRILNAACIEKNLGKLGIVEYKRLRWFVEYSDNPFAKAAHYLLQFFQLDGVLRYILRKRK